jgi:hypothetical protein
MVMKKKKSGIFEDPQIITDPDGSYTGKPQDWDEMPVQDVDDL